ncbi:MAG: efflux RND transporter permease subunit, partial [Bradymonadaceae bacterium]
MKSIIAFFVDRPLVVNLITVAVCVLGAIQLTDIPRTLLPGQPPGSIEVEAELPGASAIDMERTVTFRLEEAISGLEAIEKMTSTTVNGNTTITIEVKPEYTDLTGPMEDIRSRI